MKLVALFLLRAAPLVGQSLTVYSEFERITPWGAIVPQDGSDVRREIISPAAARNGFLTFHVAVTAPPGTTYFLFVETNPPRILPVTLYKELFTSSGVPDGLEPARPPYFGVIPDGQTTRVYLLDIWVPPEVEPGRRVRLEVQLKTGGWVVYPMEVRIANATVPDASGGKVETGPVDAPSDSSITFAMNGYLAGITRPIPAGIYTVRDAIARNAAQDMALALLSDSPDVWLLLTRQFVPGYITAGPEWYLRLRDLIYRRHR